MKPATRILVQLLLGIAFGSLTVSISELIFSVFTKERMPSGFWELNIVINWIGLCLGSLFGIRIADNVLGKKQKYIWSLMVIPFIVGFGSWLSLSDFSEFLFKNESKIIETEFLIVVLALVTPTLLMIVATHLENRSRKRSKLSRHS